MTPAARTPTPPTGRPDFDRGFVHTMGLIDRRLCTDSRLVRPGDVFAAVPGHRVDGRDFVGHAVQAGASAVLWDPSGRPPMRFDDLPVPHMAVPELNWRLGWIAAEMARHPSASLWTIGITGTNGKTSCSHWLAQALSACGTPCGRIGTLGYGIDTLSPLANTTPDGGRLQEILAELRNAGATAVAMEVSSHALAEGRVHGVAFDVAVFTNLTRDHLDYHGTLEAYGAAKERLFHWDGLQHAVIVTDADFGLHLAGRIDHNRTQVLTVGRRGDVRVSQVQCSAEGVACRLDTPWGAVEMRSGLIGRFNVDNLACVAATLLVSGVPLGRIADAIAALTPVPGRMQVLRRDGAPTVVVDYAHTPDALGQALASLREGLPTNHRLHCVFGCGGDRDPGKRAAMGAVAAKLADVVTLTSDNPRSEDPDAIIATISAGIPASADATLHTEPDRASAIAHAILGAAAGDVVLLAGKGHETWQEIAGRRLPFNDAEHARAALDAWTGARA